MTRDPVCGMEIDEKKAAAKATQEGKTYYFCAVACREAFEKASARYVAGQPRPVERSKHKGAA